MAELWELVLPIAPEIKNKEERIETCRVCLFNKCCRDEGHPIQFKIKEGYVVLTCAWRARDKLSQIKQLITILRR